MKTKIFALKHTNLKLKIQICDKYVITSWLHFGNKEFTNDRRFPIIQLNFAFTTLSPACNVAELFDIEKFMFYKPEINQLSLF